VLADRTKNIVFIALGMISLLLVHYLQLLFKKDVQLDISSLHIPLLKFFEACLTVIFLLWVSKKCIDWIKQRMNVVALHPSNQVLIVNMLNIFRYFILFLFFIRSLDISLTTFAFLSGGLAVGIGFGIQKIASNFISGIIVLFDKSIMVGDLLQVDENTIGFLKSTGAIYTLIQTIDGRTVLIPNEALITNRLTNLTYETSNSRLTINVDVHHSNDLEKVKNILTTVAKQHPHVCLDKEILCSITKFAKDNMHLELQFWVEDVVKDGVSTKSEVIFEIWKQFKEGGIKDYSLDC
jgi:small-conductance mechanosensitive channel